MCVRAHSRDSIDQSSTRNCHFSSPFSRIAAARLARCGSDCLHATARYPPYHTICVYKLAASLPPSVAINNNDRWTWKKNSHVRYKPVSMMVHNLITENSIERTSSNRQRITVIGIVYLKHLRANCRFGAVAAAIAHTITLDEMHLSDKEGEANNNHNTNG